MGERIIARHKARGDDGTIYDITEIQEFEEHRTVNGEWVRWDGFKRLELDGGGYLNWKGDDAFEIVSTGEIIRKIS
ncbi:hypothetical protein [Mesorhizobium kowhaii]|uniref:Uncharacterized protein n=1 Tax=Mesorhizobium kowhaii TaxID=1300272 RepID=A0A2W7C308_9HYPH|nr:hypothetical protein [Mesorhizobium kowhaii]PZV37482.1 hypothetical protein B5V02_14375 [Mesorhizobium kowhaii]